MRGREFKLNQPRPHVIYMTDEVSGMIDKLQEVKDLNEMTLKELVTLRNFFNNFFTNGGNFNE